MWACALLVGAVMAVGSADAGAASSGTGDVSVCDRSFQCQVLPPTTWCEPTPIVDIWAVRNTSTSAVEFYDDGGCTVAVVTVMPWSMTMGQFQASSYRMR